MTTKIRTETLRLIDSFQSRIEQIENEIDFLCSHCPAMDAKLLPPSCNVERCEKTNRLVSTIWTLEEDQSRLYGFL